MSAAIMLGQDWPTSVSLASTRACISTSKFAEDRLPKAPLQYALTLEDVGCLLDAALIMVNQRHEILAATALARTYLHAGAGLAERGGVLQFRRCSTERNFRVFLRQCTVPGDGTIGEDNPTPDLFGIPDPEGHIHYVMWHLSWLGETAEGCVLLAVADLAATDSGVRRASVTAVFGLSAREAQLAELFSKGLRLEQIARRMGVTLNTARVHLRQVFLKTNCSSQLELARVFSKMHSVTGPLRPNFNITLGRREDVQGGSAPSGNAHGSDGTLPPLGL